jgi:hypothetical protein
MRIVDSQCENWAENWSENQVTQWELPNTAIYTGGGQGSDLFNNHRFQVFGKNQNKWTTGFSYLKKKWNEN